jgi:glyoxylase-like metal-dependent hydrolase (beta-lactamase superfamily II)
VTTNDSLNSTVTLDLEHQGRERYIAGCLLDCHGEFALLDPGPSSTVDILRRKLHDKGVAISDIGSILLTHVHLDHSGVTGYLIEENPKIRVFVHKKGAPHLIDPRRLLESASSVLGRNVEDYWGPMLPLPVRNIVTLNGGEEVVIGNRRFEVLYTPGHAIHHISFFEADTKVAFVGDAAGVRISDSFVYPATPPSDVHLQHFDASLDLIQGRRPQNLFLTHFGLMGNVEWHIAELRERLQRWSEFVSFSLERPGDDSLHAREFSEMVTAELHSVLKEDEAAWFEKLISPRQNWYGLARYLRQHRGSP